MTFLLTFTGFGLPSPKGNICIHFLLHNFLLFQYGTTRWMVISLYGFLVKMSNVITMLCLVYKMLLHRQKSITKILNSMHWILYNANIQVTVFFHNLLQFFHLFCPGFFKNHNLWPSYPSKRLWDRDLLAWSVLVSLPGNTCEGVKKSGSDIMRSNEVAKNTQKNNPQSIYCGALELGWHFRISSNQVKGNGDNLYIILLTSHWMSASHGEEKGTALGETPLDKGHVWEGHQSWAVSSWVMTTLVS